MGILDGTKIIEMGHWVAVPSACGVLADWGADVIKIEPLTGDAARGLGPSGETAGEFRVNGVQINWRIELHNRGKRSVAIDLTQDTGREIVYKLVKDADVFASNYEPQALAKLGMDYETVRRYNPAIIYGLVSGYGLIGPDKDERGFDYAAAWAHSGIQQLLGAPGDVPPPQRGGMMDRNAGFYLITGILGALFHRQKTGQGEQVHVSLYHAGVWTLAADTEAALLGIPLPKPRRIDVRNPLANIYRTKDDRWLQLIMLQADLQWPGFCRALGITHLENDVRFYNMLARAINHEEFINICDDIIATKTLAEWEPLLRTNGCIFSRVQTPTEVTQDSQAIMNGFFATVPHPVAGEMKLVTGPVDFTRNPARPKAPAPEIGQHTEEILLGMGYTWEDIGRLKEGKVIL
jgi:crotonobetainyl-CoA:carnitine CoA-transferase CaiB-like acyl-CoA transferase